MKKIKKIMLVLPTILFSNLTFAEDLDQQKNWDFSFEAYAIAVNIEGNGHVGSNNLPDVDLDLSTKDIINVLDVGAMLHTEGLYKDTWGYSFDYSFMSLSEGGQFKDMGNVNTEGGVYQGVLELKGFKRYKYDFGTIDYMAGFRWWDNNLSLDVNRPSIKKSGDNDLDVDWVDYVVGARIKTPISKNWTYHLTTDLGISKDTYFTGQINTGFRYSINDWSDINLAYKAIWVNHNQDDFAYDTVTHGAIIGYGVYF